MFEPKLTPKQYVQRNNVGVSLERKKLHALEMRMLSAPRPERSRIAKYARHRLNVIGELYQREKISAMLLDDQDYAKPFKILASELVQIAKRYKLLAGN